MGIGHGHENEIPHFFDLVTRCNGTVQVSDDKTVSYYFHFRSEWSCTQVGNLGPSFSPLLASNPAAPLTVHTPN